jgi:acyl-CoA hydrolase
MHIDELPHTRVSHLVRSGDLNHHGTLFAGRMSEWVVEAGFIGAQRALEIDPAHLVCLKIHGLIFTKGALSGNIVDLVARPAYVGRTSITVYVEAFIPRRDEAPVLDGFITFVCVRDGESAPHGLEVERPAGGEALRLWKKAEQLRKA